VDAEKIHRTLHCLDLGHEKGFACNGQMGDQYNQQGDIPDVKIASTIEVVRTSSEGMLR
jgi:hypothetical protein